MKKHLLFFLLFVFGYGTTGFSQQVIELQSAPAPAGLTWEKAEQRAAFPNSSDEYVANISQPTLTAYLPDPAGATGTALIIAPGGGFHFLSITNEGSDVAAWCLRQGIAAFVLKYRVVPTGGNPMMEFMEKMQRDQEQMDRDMAPVIALAKADGRAAIEYVRKHAEAFGVNPDRIGIMGFSAGGTVAAAAAFEYTSAENRPDFVAPIYPALHVVDMEKMPAAPMPMFLAVTSDDVFGFQTLSAELYKQWNGAGQPIEMHIYQEGGHGFGMHTQNLPSDRWIDAFGAWLEALKW